jgi:hypothetical protein
MPARATISPSPKSSTPDCFGSVICACQEGGREVPAGIS